jgi:hypothetical protein
VALEALVRMTLADSTTGSIGTGSPSFVVPTWSVWRSEWPGPFTIVFCPVPTYE